MGKWKYFTDDEVAGLSEELIKMLDEMREIAGMPIVITCGFRSVEHNAEVGGVTDSAHTKGLAVDIHCPDSMTRYILISAAFKVGFKRIEAATEHIHVDIDESLPQNVMWLGVSH